MQNLREKESLLLGKMLTLSNAGNFSSQDLCRSLVLMFIRSLSPLFYSQQMLGMLISTTSGKCWYMTRIVATLSRHFWTLVHCDRRVLLFTWRYFLSFVPSCIAAKTYVLYVYRLLRSESLYRMLLPCTSCAPLRQISNALQRTAPNKYAWMLVLYWFIQ